MPYNGTGTFNRIYSWAVDAATSVAISSSRTDAEMNGFAAGLTNCITRDGQSPPSADLPMGGKKLTNLGTATVAGDALSQAAGDARYLVLSAGAFPKTVTFNNAGSGAASGTSFDGTTNITISYNSIGAVPSTSPTFHGNVTLADNNVALVFTDANAGTPRIQCQSDNNLVLLSTTSAGAARLVFSILCHNDASALVFGVPTTGQTPATADNSTNFATTAYVQAQGYSAAIDALKDVASNAKAASYTLALTDRGGGVDFNGASLTCTIPANASVAFPVGATILITNRNASNLSIAITTDTLTLAGTTTSGTRTLAQNGMATLRKVTSTAWLISGAGLT